MAKNKNKAKTKNTNKETKATQNKEQETTQVAQEEVKETAKTNTIEVVVKSVLTFEGENVGLRVGVPERNVITYYDVDIDELGEEFNKDKLEGFPTEELQNHDGVLATTFESTLGIELDALEGEKLEAIKEGLVKGLNDDSLVKKAKETKEVSKGVHGLGKEGDSELLYVVSDNNVPESLVFVRHHGNSNSYNVVGLKDIRYTTGYTIEHLSKVKPDRMVKLAVKSNDGDKDFTSLVGVPVIALYNQFEIEKVIQVVR